MPEAFNDTIRWQQQQDRDIQAVEQMVNDMRPDLAVLKSDLRTLNRRFAWVLAFLASLTLAVLSAAVVIALAVARG